VAVRVDGSMTGVTYEIVGGFYEPLARSDEHGLAGLTYARSFW
jgi:hypothetical protein